MKLLLMIFFTFIFHAQASEYSNTFVVKIHPQVIKVTSPKTFNAELSVIVENKSMVRVLGKVINESDTFEKIISIKAGEFKSVPIRMKKNENFYFVPMSPPFQRIELQIGQKDYEIPAKK